MKEPNDPPDDIEEIFRKAFDEMFTGASDKLVYAEYPVEVAARLDAYTEEHSLDSSDLLNLALEAGYIEPAITRWGEKIIRLVDDFDLFDWPIEDPLSCVVIGIMRQLVGRCAKKVREKREVTEPDSADWWKADS
jgi:hypothetical protein